MTPEISTAPANTSGTQSTTRADGFSPKQRPGGDRDEHDLEVAERRREARAHVVDRVVPEDQVDGEERARGRRETPVARAGEPRRHRSRSASSPRTGSA